MSDDLVERALERVRAAEVALARVEQGREKDAERHETAWRRMRDQRNEARAERDALRAQVKALTGERAVQAALSAASLHWTAADEDDVRAVLAAARDAAAANPPDQPDS